MATHNYTRVLAESSSQLYSPEPSPALKRRRRPISLEEGWGRLFREGIQKLHRIIKEKGAGKQFTKAEHVALYTLVFDMCNQKAPHCYTDKLYALFKQSVLHYLQTVSLPAIQACHLGSYMVQEIVAQWEDHKLISRWMCCFFEYLNRFYVRRGSLPTLEQVCTDAFKSAVFEPTQAKLTNTLLSLILSDRETIAAKLADEWKRKSHGGRRQRDIDFLGVSGGSEGKLGDQKGAWGGRMGLGGVRSGPSSPISGGPSGVDRRVIHQAIQVYIAMDSNLNVYRNTLEILILRDTSNWYTSRCNQQLNSLDCPEYLLQTEADIAAESQRISDLFHPSSRDKLLDVVRECMLIKRQQEILRRPTGVLKLLQLAQIDALARLYNLYAPCGHASLVNICDIVREYISNKGSDILAQAREAGGNQGEAVVKSLLGLHERCYKLVEGPFQGSPLFHKALKEAFENVVNHRVRDVSIGEMLAERMHNLLKKGGASKGLTPQQLQKELNALIALFLYVADKDQFAEFYRNDLAMRLLHNRTASMDTERIVIGKLKFSCGAQYTSKIEGMITDAKNAAEVSERFNKWMRKRRHQQRIATPNEKHQQLIYDQGGDFSVRILTSGFWPSQPEEHVRLPKTVTATLAEFEKYYEKSFGKRRLKWIHSLASVTIEGNFRNRSYEFSVNGFQACVLIAINQHPNGVSILELTKQTLLPPAVMKRVLLCLVLKSKLLSKKPAKDYRVTDIIAPNPNFSSSQRRLRIPSHIIAKDSKTKSRKAMIDAVSEDRKGALESAIVRVLKIRKKIKHRDLIQQVTSLIATRNQFRPDPRQIKQSIESLMSREYLERDTSIEDGYRYLA